MVYKFALQKENYEKYAAWRVLYSIPWSAPFPVRHIDDIFQRAYELLWTNNKVNIYDPCIGSGYMMTVLWLLHGDKINSISWSDIDQDMIKIAEKNLELLQTSGINNRIIGITRMIENYQKQSHISALKDANDIKSIVTNQKHYIKTECDVSNIVDLNFSPKYDMIMFDLPYWNITSRQWDIEIVELIEKLWSWLKVWWVLIVIWNKDLRLKASWGNTKKSINHGKRRIFLIKK